MYNEELEKLIEMALMDGELTEKEKQILFKKAEKFGVDLDEFEMVLDAKLYEKTKSVSQEKQETSAPKSDKFGDVKKCPSCGAIVQSLQAVCSDCGHEFAPGMLQFLQSVVGLQSRTTGQLCIMS